MKSGNIPERENIKLEHIDSFPPPFKQSKYEKKIVFSPYQKYTLDSNQGYIPLDFECDQVIIDQKKLRTEGTSYFNDILNIVDSHETVLWVDPRFVSSVDLALIVSNWKNNPAIRNANLAIVFPETNTIQYTNSDITFWEVNTSTLNYSPILSNPIWYPSLTRETEQLNEYLDSLNPYDTYPLIDFPDFATQMGESTLTDHVGFLERAGARTRNFIYFDIFHPERAFNQFYNILKSLPKMNSPVFQAVITPGGNFLSYLISLLAGVLSNSSFLLSKNEIPIKTYLEVQGILILRKIT